MGGHSMHAPPAAAPTIMYARRPFVVAIGAGLCPALLLTVYGAAAGRLALLGAGLGLLCLTAVFAYAFKPQLRGGATALARQGELLVGVALRHPVPIAGTSFDIQSDNEGSWVVVLFTQGRRLVLGPGGWKVEGEKKFTRAVAERELLAMGLHRR